MAGIAVEDCMDLPPGFWFHPTDEEIITHYLSPKIVSRGFTARAIGDVDLNKCEPWELPGKANMGEKEWYFFCQRDRKYPTGMRTNRATDAGYWKATGKDKEIYRGRGVLVGMKKTLVFYKGRAPKGEKTNWVMHEFRLDGKSNLANIPKAVKDEWVVCRVFHKNICLKKVPQQPGMERADDSVGKDDFFDAASTTMPALTDRHNAGRNSRPEASRFLGGHDIDNDFDFKSNSSFSNLLGIENQQELTMGSNPAIANAGDYYPQLPPPSSHYALPASNMGNLYQEKETLRALVGSAAARNNDASSAIRKHCKVEQYSNQSMGCPSQDTGLNFDHNSEISSVVSKHYVHELDDSCGAVTDYSFFWNSSGELDQFVRDR